MEQRNEPLTKCYLHRYSWRIVNALGIKAKSSKVIENYERYMLLRILDRH
ncbi:MAG: hypothetical protein LM567_05970 [Desulfurococcaceae archaeon]|nr:hypothetical protein [Desulfurococcaceae archaeon]